MPRVELEECAHPLFHVATFSPTDECDDSAVHLNTNDYQGREASIIPGISATELLMAHRRTLANLHSDKEPGSGNIEMLHSITLSRRHLEAAELYHSRVDKDVFESLSEYRFGDSADLSHAVDV